MADLWRLFSVFFRIGLFTVGGGYAMLPMLKREVVEHYGWLEEEELLNVFAIGQSTPGIIAVNVATYVGTKHRGLFGALVATGGMVLPSLLIICLIATFFMNFQENPYVAKAFAGIRIAVAAMLLVIVSGLARKAIKDLAGVLLFGAAFCLIVIFNLPTFAVVLGGGLVGVLYYSIMAGRGSASSAGTEEKP
jgi:chromate transporter